MSFTEKCFTSSTAHGAHKIVYNEYGPPAGRPVLCVHYLTGNGYYFHALAQDLARREYRVLVPDLPGRGRSDFLQDPADYSFHQYTKDIAGLLNHAGVKEKIDWIGASMGGAIGITTAARFDIPMRSLSLIDIGPVVPSETIDTIAAYVAHPPQFATLPDLAAALKASRGQAWGPVTEGYWHFMAEHNARALPDGNLTYAYDPAITKIFIAHGKESLWQEWEKISCPVMVIHGYKSMVLTKEIAAMMKAKKPDLNLVTFKDCGHVPSMTMPEQINEITKWLSTIPT